MNKLQTVFLSILALSLVAILFMYNAFFSATPYFNLKPEVEKQLLSEMAAYNNCLSETLDENNECQFQCHATRASEHDDCSDSYSGSNALIENNQQKYNTCVSESVIKHTNCFTGCSQQYDPMKCSH